jgi:predicted dehydrogenase
VIQSLSVVREDAPAAAVDGEGVVRVGVVGGGLVAQVAHLPRIRDLDTRLRLVGLAEPDRVTRETVARRFAIPIAVADHRDLLERGAVDAIVVCSPNATHAGVVLDALDAGAHVLVEKPMCITLADADRIVAARDRTGLVVQVAYMKRFDPAYEALLDELQADSARHVTTITYDPVLAPWFAPRHRRTGPDVALDALAAEQVAEATGTDAPDEVQAFSNRFLGALVHDVNAVHGAMQRIGVPLPDRVVDAFSVDGGRACGGSVALEDGGRWTMAWLELPGLGDFREEIALFGADGIRRLEFPAPYAHHQPTVYTRVAPAGGGSESRAFRSWHEAYARQLEHFHECIVGGLPCRTPPEQARSDIALLTELFRASIQVPA